MNFLVLILYFFVENQSILWMLVLFNLISFIFTAIGLYRISKNRGYIGNHKSWFAIVPALQLLLMGAVTDNINMLSRKKTNYRIVFLVLYGVSWVFKVIVRIIERKTTEYISQNQLMSMGIIFFTIFSTLIISTITLVYMYIALFNIYKDYVPNSANLYIILSILFGISPFLLFAIRNEPSISIHYAKQAGQSQQQYNQYNNYNEVKRGF